MISIEQIAGWCEPWNHVFAHSKLVSGSVTGVHIMALVLGGGLAISADRLTLRAHSRDRASRISQLREVRAVHMPVLIGLAVLFISGILLALSDVETFFPSPVFWIKAYTRNAAAHQRRIAHALRARAQRRDSVVRAVARGGSAVVARAGVRAVERHAVDGDSRDRDRFVERVTTRNHGYSMKRIGPVQTIAN